jgi:S-layer homology domain.
VEVLKAYNIGAVNGTSTTTYAPDALLNREQAATMLTRVFKKITLAGWTLATDGNFSLDYTKPAAFADDADISAWAKDSVYFMAANGIINGVGSNKFAPKNVTSADEANGYANATREQALLIAVRMVQNLKQD